MFRARPSTVRRCENVLLRLPSFRYFTSNGQPVAAAPVSVPARRVHERYERLGKLLSTFKYHAKPPMSMWLVITLYADIGIIYQVICSCQGVLAGARGSRTHRPGGSTGTNDFEDRRAHRSPSAPIISRENIGQVWTARVPLPDSLRGGRLGAQDRVHGSLELPSRHRAHDLVDRTAALEDQQRGNTPDTVLQGRLGI